MGSRQDNPFPDSYDVDLSDVEADSSGETEAGTKQRDLVRHPVFTGGQVLKTDQRKAWK